MFPSNPQIIKTGPQLSMPGFTTYDQYQGYLRGTICPSSSLYQTMPSGQLSISNSSDQRFVSTDHSLTDPTPHPLDHCSNHSLQDTPFAIEQYADIVCGGLTINSKPCVVVSSRGLCDFDDIELIFRSL